MAAYAAVVSLLNILDQIQDYPRIFITLHQDQIQLLQQNLLFFLHFLDTGLLHRGIEEEAQVLETQITSAAYAAEDVIETHVVVHQIHLRSPKLDQREYRRAKLYLQHKLRRSKLLDKVKQDMDYVKEKVVAFKDQIRGLKPTYSPASASSSSSSETPLTYAASVSFLDLQTVIQDMDYVKEKVVTFKEEIRDLIKPKYYPTSASASSETPFTYAAEDVIEETHVVDQIQAAAASVLLLDRHTVIQHTDYVKEKVEQIKDMKPTFYPSSASTSSQTPLTITGKSTMVGFDDHFYQLMDALTGRQSTLQIITIVGMGGIGKTTLAKNVYERLHRSKHFDICAWATISQEYDINDIISNLLSRETKSTLETEDQQLALDLHKMLMNRRYLIVLDDMWSIGVWDKIRNFFPDNNNGSRVIITTRQSDMAACFSNLLLPLKLLDEDKSWELFCEKAFPQQGYCPSDLEVFGKKIVKKCGGLPLLIVVIGALLGKSSRTRRYWEDMSRDINSILNSGEEEMKSLDILRLSYRHLPAHLKPCILYIVTFPEDHKIHVPSLIKLWVAEGFVRSNETQNLEEVARSYLKDLIDRNLLVLRTDRYGRRKTCEMHDLLRDLCLKIAEKENFVCVIRASDILQEGIVNKGRRIVFEVGAFRDGLKSASPLTRSLVSDYDRGNLDSIEFKLLRVLRCNDVKGILKHLVNLRYCRTFQAPFDISSKIPLWNLQTLIITEGKRLVAPPEIWEMRQLRHVAAAKLYLPDPPSSHNQRADEVVVLRNLMTLSVVIDLKLSEEVCKRIPNVKKLWVRYLLGSSSCDFGHLHKIESLRCCFRNNPKLNDLLQNLTFPSSLRKLSLEESHLRWEDLSMIGSLPHLQVLKLEYNSVTGPEWNPVEGEFVRLKSLSIEYNDLKNWNADRSSFPVLENLCLCKLWNLDEIPFDIGEIPTLGFIELLYCSESAAISAMEILEEQESLGNEGLRVRICFEGEARLWSFNRKVQHMKCFTSTNLELIY